MARILHILKSQPDEKVAEIISATSRDDLMAVVCLYTDEISGTTVDWSRLVEDIFIYDRAICWW